MRMWLRMGIVEIRGALGCGNMIFFFFLSEALAASQHGTGAKLVLIWFDRSKGNPSGPRVGVGAQAGIISAPSCAPPLLPSGSARGTQINTRGSSRQERCPRLSPVVPPACGAWQRQSLPRHSPHFSQKPSSQRRVYHLHTVLHVVQCLMFALQSRRTFIAGFCNKSANLTQRAIITDKFSFSAHILWWISAEVWTPICARITRRGLPLRVRIFGGGGGGLSRLDATSLLI